MARQTEKPANYELAKILLSMIHNGEALFAEQTQILRDHAGRQPDILIAAPRRSPIVIETEVMPAREVEDDALSRLGLVAMEGGKVIEAAVALRYPLDIRSTTVATLEAFIRAARMEWCVFTQPQEGVTERFPQDGWLEGGVEDLADMVRLVSLPQRVVDKATKAMEEGIEDAAQYLQALDNAVLTGKLAGILGMDNVPQSLRMACAVLANALVFHERIANLYCNIDPLSNVCGPSIANPKDATLIAWQHILAINYWPIFAVARNLLSQLNAELATEVLRRLRGTAETVNSVGIDNAHDLTGRVFQRLIADRKYLATFYTLPASAALLARLAVAKLQGVDWGDAEAVGKLRVADFACGTGALLSAVYEQIAARYERVGGDPAALHTVMMEEVLTGCDVMPSAVHITGSTLSGIQPRIRYGRTNLHVMPYGRVEGQTPPKARGKKRAKTDPTVKLGSLELLDKYTQLTLADHFSGASQRLEAHGLTSGQNMQVEFPDEGYDLIIMNPPFTRNSNKEGKYADTFAGAFAGFGTTDEEQRLMAKLMGKFRRETCYHGHAGMASAFAALANRKLKPGGVLALVLPLTATAGTAWEAFRQMLAMDYKDVQILSIIGYRDGQRVSGRNPTSFSSDTGMAECLVVARKYDADVGTESTQAEHADEGSPRPKAEFTSLLERPASIAQSAALVSALSKATDMINGDEGDIEGAPVLLGNVMVGETSANSIDPDGAGWGAGRMTDNSLAQMAVALAGSMLEFPGSWTSAHIPIKALSSMGLLGRHALDITGRPKVGPPQGPFDRYSPSPTATYPCLWNHDAAKETRIVCSPDSQLRVRSGMKKKANAVWSRRSRAHHNVDFQYNSQPLCVAFTDSATVGGRAWPNVKFENSAFDYAFALWGNSTLGLISHWWHANRRQLGRGSITLSSARSLPVLDFRTLTDAQLATAERIFEEFRDKELLPAYLSDADPNRALLDRRVVCDLLGFDEDVYQGVRRLAQKWCAEPSVHGGKARPTWAKGKLAM